MTPMADAPPVLSQINLVVRDMDATLAFYRRLGVEIPEDSARRGPHHTEVELPNGFLLEFDTAELAKAYNASSRGPGGGGGVLGFSLPSREAVDERYAELTAAGYEGCNRPYDAFWGARYAIVADPDGNQIGLMSPVDPIRRSAPPDLA
jgi:catechol 2,3-dioxygenase-like lactoylglutathione lyase family enzyme